LLQKCNQAMLLFVTTNLPLTFYNVRYRS
jgi:hypothetical protein